MCAIGAGLAAGCRIGSLTHAATPDLKEITELQGFPRIALPQKSIDVHTHFFNASDASVIGYFTHSMNHQNPKFQCFLERMNEVLKALISIAPTARDELIQLQALEGQKISQDAMERVLELQDQVELARIAKEIAGKMREFGIKQEFGKGFDSNKGFQSIPSDEDEIRILIDPDSEDVNKSLVARGQEIAGVFRFLGCMLQKRSMSLRAFQRGHGKRGVSAAFGALVDFDYFYDDLARSPLADQVQLHSLLARQSRGFMLPLISYNPWADIKSGGARLRLLTEAVEKYGFIGAKIYPPVGFLPVGNTTTIGELDPKELNATLKRFFLECSRLEIPVMAHANSTQGRDYEANQNSRPEVWKALINEMAKEGKVPLLNLGHFGGDGCNGVDKESNDWPLRFAKLTEEEGGQGIYGDIGNWTALRRFPANDHNCKSAADRLAEVKRKYPELEQRLMYGSDWFMMIKEIAWKDWPEDIASAMSSIKFDLNKVFHQNAMDCFGLSPGRANRRRLENFFSGDLPAWMS